MKAPIRFALDLSCEADPSLSCEDLHAANLQYCAGAPSPPQVCVDQCFGDPTFPSKCGEVANCTREADAAYAHCVALGN